MFSGTNVHETRTGNIKYSQHAEMSALREFIKFTLDKYVLRKFKPSEVFASISCCPWINMISISGIDNKT